MKTMELITVSYLSGSIMCKGSKPKPCHGHNSEECKLHFVVRIESLSILPTTLRSRVSMWTCYTFACWLSQGDML